MPSLTIYPSRFKLIRGVIAGVLLTALFIAILFYHDQWHVDVQWWLIAYPGIPVATLATLYWLIRLLRHRPALCITPDGIIDTSSAVGVGLIRWQEIARIGMKTTKAKGGKNIYLTITPRDMKAVLARQASPLTKLYDSVGETIDIGQVMLPAKIPQVLPQIQAYYQQHIVPSGGAPIVFDEASAPG